MPLASQSLPEMLSSQQDPTSRTQKTQNSSPYSVGAYCQGKSKQDSISRTMPINSSILLVAHGDNPVTPGSPPSNSAAMSSRIAPMVNTSMPTRSHRCEDAHIFTSVKMYTKRIIIATSSQTRLAAQSVLTSSSIGSFLDFDSGCHILVPLKIQPEPIMSRASPIPSHQGRVRWSEGDARPCSPQIFHEHIFSRQTSTSAAQLAIRFYKNIGL